MSLDGKTRREFIGSALSLPAVLALGDDVLAQARPREAPSLDDLPVLKRRRISWDAVKKFHDQYHGMNDRQKAANQRNYHKIISKYLDQVLVDEFQIVHDKRRNPYGFMGEWYLWNDPKQREEVVEKTRKEWTNGPDNADVITKVFGASEFYWIAPKMLGFEVPSGARRGYIIADDSVFKLGSEDELFSSLDYLRSNAYAHEFGIDSGDKKWEDRDMNARIYRGQVVCLKARIDQLENILSGKRKVSSNFRSEVTSKYLSLYSNCVGFAADLDKDSRNSSNPYAKFNKHNADLIRTLMSDAEARFNKHGYGHRKFGSRYDLVRK